MLKPYLLIRVGYEGIEDIVYFSYRKKPILKKKELATLISIRDFLKRQINMAKEGFTIRSEEEVNEHIEDIKDRFCIERWNGKRFKCVCNKLGVAPKESIFY